MVVTPKKKNKNFFRKKKKKCNRITVNLIAVQSYTQKEGGREREKKGAKGRGFS